MPTVEEICACSEEWASDQHRFRCAVLELLCGVSSSGEATPEVVCASTDGRLILLDASTGNLTELDGSPITDGATAVSCNGGGGGSGADSEILLLCDDRGGGNIQRFIRIISVDGVGAITVQDKALDGVTNFTVVGTVGQCNDGFYRADLLGDATVAFDDVAPVTLSGTVPAGTEGAIVQVQLTTDPSGFARYTRFNAATPSNNVGYRVGDLSFISLGVSPNDHKSDPAEVTEFEIIGESGVAGQVYVTYYRGND